MILIILLISSAAYSQAFNEWKHRIGYFGNNFINPGLEYTLETPLYDTDNRISLLLPLGRTTSNLSGHLAYYWDPFSHMGLLNYYELNGRQYISQRLGLQIGAGIGTQFNFTNDNYKIDDEFNVKSRNVNTDVYIIPEISFGVVYLNGKLSREYISKINIFFLTPYNNGLLPSFNYSLNIAI